MKSRAVNRQNPICDVTYFKKHLKIPKNLDCSIEQYLPEDDKEMFKRDINTIDELITLIQIDKQCYRAQFLSKFFLNNRNEFDSFFARKIIHNKTDILELLSILPPSAIVIKQKFVRSLEESLDREFIQEKDFQKLSSLTKQKKSSPPHTLPLRSILTQAQYKTLPEPKISEPEASYRSEEIIYSSVPSRAMTMHEFHSIKRPAPQDTFFANKRRCIESNTESSNMSLGEYESLDKFTFDYLLPEELSLPLLPKIKKEIVVKKEAIETPVRSKQIVILKDEKLPIITKEDPLLDNKEDPIFDNLEFSAIMNAQMDIETPTPANTENLISFRLATKDDFQVIDDIDMTLENTADTLCLSF
jgi:hypothetical protein